MKLYDEIKELNSLLISKNVSAAQFKLTEITNLALEMEAEMLSLKEKVLGLEKRSNIEEHIVRYEDPYITLDNDTIKVIYCAHCWDSEQKLIQVYIHDTGYFSCPHCQISAPYDRGRIKLLEEEAEQANSDLENIVLY